MRRLIIMLVLVCSCSVCRSLGYNQDSKKKNITVYTDILAITGKAGFNLGFSYRFHTNWEIGAQTYIKKDAYKLDFCFLPKPEQTGVYIIGSFSIYKKEFPKWNMGIGYEVPIYRNIKIKIEATTDGLDKCLFALKIAYKF